MSWLERFVDKIRVKSDDLDKSVPQGIWTKCHHCDSILYQEALEVNYFVCPKCDFHMIASPKHLVEMLFDGKYYDELGAHIVPIDALKFKDSKKYTQRLTQAQKDTEAKDALMVAEGKINDMSVTVAVFNFKFMGGSMGSVVGERFVLGAKNALKKKQPFICLSASGGARMQEGLFSLMQMARTSHYIAQLKEARLPYISVLMNPTYGGVSASLAMLGDINVAEPGAFIGFAGPRVIEQTVREKLPAGFQSSEFLEQHGAVDLIVKRSHLKETLSNILSMLLSRQDSIYLPKQDD